MENIVNESKLTNHYPQLTGNVDDREKVSNGY